MTERDPKEVEYFVSSIAEMVDADPGVVGLDELLIRVERRMRAGRSRVDRLMDLAFRYPGPPMGDHAGANLGVGYPGTVSSEDRIRAWAQEAKAFAEAMDEVRRSWDGT